jgi:hypothetical protein
MDSLKLKNKIDDLKEMIADKKVRWGHNAGPLTDEQVEKKKVQLVEHQILLHQARQNDDIDRWGFKRVEQNA